MTRKKAPRRKKPVSRRKSTSKAPGGLQLLKIGAAVALLLAIVVVIGVLTHYLIGPRPVSKRMHPPPTATRASEPQPKSAAPQVTYEIYPKREHPPATPRIKPEVLTPRGLPKVAIIIDDIGYDSDMAYQFLALDAVLTFSLLPQSPFQNRIISAVRAKGYEIMLHQPMEPNEYPDVNPGPGALFTSMRPDELIQQLNRNLDSIPFVSGVNNHMGSKLTTSSEQLRQVFTILKKRKLYFIDSRTTAATLCRPSAGLLQVPFAERDVFLDHNLDPAFIRKQLDLLVQVAKRDGQAIGIAHPHPSTQAVLRERLPFIKTHVELVPASQVVHIPG